MVKENWKNHTFYGAYHISLEVQIKEVIKKLEEIGITNPTKIEASAFIAHRQKKNINFMTEKQIKEFISAMRIGL